MTAGDCILFSGGAPGAEARFGACAERHGVEEVNFTFDGHRIERHRGVRVLNHEELLTGDVSLAYVSRLMHRRYTEGPTLRKILQTLWYQVNNGQEIYVIGTIQDDLTVRGGTGCSPARLGWMFVRRRHSDAAPAAWAAPETDATWIAKVPGATARSRRACSTSRWATRSSSGASPPARC